MKENIINFCIMILCTALFISLIIVSFFKITGIGALDSKEEVEKCFYKNINYFLNTADYIENMDGLAVIIHDEDYSKKWAFLNCSVEYKVEDSVGTEFRDVKIEDPELLENLKPILGYGFDTIRRSSNFILFQGWDRLADADGGLVYSLDGKTPQIEYISLCEPLNQENWYYYETDFNKWRSMRDQKADTKP